MMRPRMTLLAMALAATLNAAGLAPLPELRIERSYDGRSPAPGNGGKLPTPGAFGGNPWRKPRRAGAGIARRIAAGGKVRGY